MQSVFKNQLAALEQISDREFVKSFEDHSLNPQLFGHLGHLYIAWLYLQKFPEEQAIEKVCDGIKSYANSLGAPDKFHLTITDTLVRIIHQKIQQTKPHSFGQFIKQNDDLLEDAVSLLHTYFSPQLLNSAEARRYKIEPDRQRFVNE
ncbi:MAG: hypothetical protein OQK04_08685 [Kangiellaceae bacterium]|nr:hypothetical protein [Kangiellaceae bacterium]MCW8998774.1 hypothetical protein [Kangiellaceae bacterium]